MLNAPRVLPPPTTHREQRLLGHTAQAVNARATQKVKENRFGLVVECMPGEYRVGVPLISHLSQRGISRVTERGFRGRAAAVGHRNVECNDITRHIKADRKRADRIGVASVIHTDTVAHMAERHTSPGSSRDGRHRVRETGAVRATGRGHEDMTYIRPGERGPDDRADTLG